VRAAFTCACGGRRSRNARQCKSCDTAARRGSDFSCEWCGLVFWRKSHNSNKADARRFCSKQCSGALKTAQARAREHVTAIETEFARAVEQELHARLSTPQQPVRICSCGAVITKKGTGYCAACLPSRVATWCRAARSVVRHEGVEHVCPNCGHSFRGYVGDVFCSQRCATQLTHHRRYPSIGAVPYPERNQLAELIALQRAANRRLHKHG
jgi:predicted RNA-binding Zn-ribbon protein involved in translation (DUF1610 family)